MVTFTQTTHTTSPCDTFEPPFAMLHYYVEEEGEGYKSVALSTDETSGFSDIEALKEHFAKQARGYALSHQIVRAKEGAEVDADSTSIATMSAMIVGAVVETLQKAGEENESLKAACEQAFAQKVAFKCADNVVRELTIAELAHAQKEALGQSSSKIVGTAK